MRIWSGLLVAAATVAVAGAAFTGWNVFGPGASAFAKGTPVELAAYTGPSPVGVPAALAGADLVTRGKYLAQAADCVACHTAKGGGTPYAGGLPFKLPFGTLYAPNITPDRETGIGNYTDAEFLTALHHGVGSGGKPLYPAFPYTAYAKLDDADVLAIKAYLFSLPAVRNVVPVNDLAFPFNQRPLMAVWAAMFNREGAFKPIPEQSAAWNRGAYLVEAAAHCGECHTPRTLFQSLDNRRKFAGAMAAGWNAYNISGDRLTGVGAWTAPELTAFLSTGHAQGRGSASGPMGEAVDMSLRHLDPADIAAIVTYLQTVPPVHTAAVPDQLAGPAPARAKLGFNGDPHGKAIFEGACASCHNWDGSGALINEATLTGARAVNDPTAVNVAQVVMSGVHRNGPRGEVYMPSFGAAYTDQEVAAVANYVTARFGSAPSKVTTSDVAKLRKLT